eukprot:SAG22_NODE_2497_length_2510_cov_1.882621_4_plen_324_part_00
MTLAGVQAGSVHRAATTAAPKPKDSGGGGGAAGKRTGRPAAVAVDDAPLAWPEPFPGFAGIFTYEVDLASDAALGSKDQEQSLGSGVYLWKLEIVAETFRTESEPDEADGRTQVSCQLRKTLLDLPLNAGAAMQGCKGKHVVEEWRGSADVATLAFQLDEVDYDSPPVETTLDFTPGVLPLPRQALAGEYQMVLAADGETVKAVHASWVVFANLRPEAAAGLLFRLDPEKVQCPMLQRSNAEQVTAQITDATELLRNSVTSKTDVPAIVHCDLNLASVSNISTTGESFDAELTIEYEYLLTRADVYAYIMSSGATSQWEPAWK